MVPPLDNKYYILSEQGVTNLVYHYKVWVEDDQLSEALKTLTEKKRNIILLSYFMDMSDSEISEFIKIPRSNVQYHRTKTLEAMRKIMEERK